MDSGAYARHNRIPERQVAQYKCPAPNRVISSPKKSSSTSLDPHLGQIGSSVPILLNTSAHSAHFNCLLFYLDSRFDIDDLYSNYSDLRLLTFTSLLFSYVHLTDVPYIITTVVMKRYKASVLEQAVEKRRKLPNRCYLSR